MLAELLLTKPAGNTHLELHPKTHQITDTTSSRFTIAACKNIAQNIHLYLPNLRLTDQSGKLSKFSEQSLTIFSVLEI